MRSENEKVLDRGFTAGFFYGVAKTKKDIIIKILTRRGKMTEDKFKHICALMI